MHRIIRTTYLGEALGDVTSLGDVGAVDAIRNAK